MLRENMMRKLWTIIGLCLVFVVVLAAIYALTDERAYFADRAGLDMSDYRMIIRSIKYGLVIVVLVFSVFFISELLRGWRIHPVQYVLVAGALSIFYLLLLSLAEQVGFVSAYVIGATACVALIVWYLRFVLPNKQGIMAMALLLCGVYIAMFVLLRLPNYSLLLGSWLLFFSLFALMYCTRYVDWYALSKAQGEHDETP